jgi:hypothetical protein
MDNYSVQYSEILVYFLGLAGMHRIPATFSFINDAIMIE